jgi:hypothetical protein
MIRTRKAFILELGFDEGQASDGLYRALMFQPRAVGTLLGIGMLVQQPWLFLALCAMLWWGALFPTSNPFDVLYNVAVARPFGGPQLRIVPAPKRFAATLAGTFALAIAVALGTGLTRVAWVLEGALAVAVLEVVILRSCRGANIYHRLVGTPGIETGHPDFNP